MTALLGLDGSNLVSNCLRSPSDFLSEHAKSRRFDAILEIEKHRGLGVPQVFKTILRWRWHPPPDIETLLELEWKSFACEAYGPRKVTPPLGTRLGGEREEK